MAPKSARSISGPSETAEQLTARLDKRLDSYRNIGLRFKDIDYARFLNLALTYPDVEKMLRFLDGFVQQDTLLSLLSIAEVAGVIYSKSTLEARDLVFLYDWLKTPEGIAAAQKVQLDKKLTKGGLPSQAPRDIAYSRLLDSMNIDLSVAIKEKRLAVDAEIADYNLLIAQKREEFAEYETQMKEEYAAAANFPPMKLRELRDLCWRKYLDKCTADGVVPIEHTSDNVALITDELRSEVTQEVVAKYCEDERIRRMLIRYGKRKVKHLKKQKKKKEVMRFRGLITTATGAPPSAPPTLSAEEDDRGDSSRESDTGSEYAELLSTVRGKAGRPSTSKANERAEEEGADPAFTGAKERTDRTPLAERTRQGHKKRKGGAKSPNPNREE